MVERRVHLMEQWKRVLQVILLLVAVHSIGFGLALIILPPHIIEFFGFRLGDKFFAMQGGVFHIIISYAYIHGAISPDKSGKFIILAIVAKFSATVFLLCYYLFANHILMVLLSGLMDWTMGLAILISYRNFLRRVRSAMENSVEESSFKIAPR